ncbi:MAG: M28 family metallopeptidase [Bacteroidota bacterium]
MLINIFRITILFLSIIILGCSQKSSVENRLDQQVLLKHIEEIASDKFLGRKPATKGEEVTISYLVDEYKKLELLPLNGDSYLQPVPFVEISPEYPKQLLIKGKSGSVVLNHGNDFVAVTKRIEEKIEVLNSDIVFAGYGIVAPEYNWNDYEGIDVKNKIVIVMVNDPGYAAADPNLFTGKKMTYYGRWTYKYEEAARQGAAGVLIIHEDGAASYPWGVVQNGRIGPQFVVDDGNKNKSKCKFEGWITLSKAKEIFSLAGLILDDELKAAAQRGFKSKQMGLNTSLVMNNKLKFLTTNNVLGYFPGSERPDEYVFYMAHWDHFGYDSTLTTEDKIYNGAVDNATGVAGILTIARAIKSLPEKPKRSAVFFAITLEEFGLLGSNYYVNHPLVPIEKTVAAINLDGLNIFGPTKNFSVIGLGLSELDNYIREEADKMGKTLMSEMNPEAGSFFRSDHFNFAKTGVPAVYISAGNEHITQPKDYMKNVSDKWVRENYHKVTDNYDPANWNFEGMMEQLQFVYNVSTRLIDGTTFPNWNENTPYKKIRDEMLKK